MAQTPKYPLEQVKELVNECIFSAPNKSSNAVITFKRINGEKFTTQEAEAWIRGHLKNLEEKDFYKRTFQWGETCDEYGKIIENETWYIKFMIEDGQLESISFHPAEKEVKLQSEVTLEKGSFVYDEECKVWRVRE